MTSGPMMREAPEQAPAPVAFIDLQAQRRRLGERIDRAIARVLEHGRFVMGPEVGLLEEKLAAFAGARHCVCCASGTDALAMVLMAWTVRAGDAVFVPAFTFVATAEVVAWLGATPVFVDVDAKSFNMGAESLDRAVEHARTQGLRPTAVIPVDLFGQPADCDAIAQVARRHGLAVLCDAAQSFGARWKGKPVGSWGNATAASFYPAKPLGCYGDGGAVFTDDDALAGVLRSVREHGQGAERYAHERIGINGRLDTIQAAILLEKLQIFPEELAARQRVADGYEDGLRDLGEAVRPPHIHPEARSAWAQYTLVLDDREDVAMRLKEMGIPTAVHYPIPLSQQAAYRHFPTGPGGVPVSEWLAQRVLSLPMHPYLEAETVRRIVAGVHAAIRQARQG